MDGNAARGGNGQMMALLARDRQTVDQAHARALANGAHCEGAPGLTHIELDLTGGSTVS
jgi:hypothetical protein